MVDIFLCLGFLLMKAVPENAQNCVFLLLISSEA